MSLHRVIDEECVARGDHRAEDGDTNPSECFDWAAEALRPLLRRRLKLVLRAAPLRIVQHATEVLAVEPMVTDAEEDVNGLQSDQEAKDLVVLCRREGRTNSNIKGRFTSEAKSEKRTVLGLCIGLILNGTDSDVHDGGATGIELLTTEDEVSSRLWLTHRRKIYSRS